MENKHHQWFRLEDRKKQQVRWPRWNTISNALVHLHAYIHTYMAPALHRLCSRTYLSTSLMLPPVTWQDAAIHDIYVSTCQCPSSGPAQDGDIARTRAPALASICLRQCAGVRGRSVDFSSRLAYWKLVNARFIRWLQILYVSVAMLVAVTCVLSIIFRLKKTVS